ncbi:MAG: hypothetical protein IJF67_00985 [Clostridia bacterium]|nr:hypothetical protein [Clostridia bacterium]
MRPYPVNLHAHDALVAKYESQPIVKGGILLYGSSFFTNWQNAADEVAEASAGKYTVVNHGFGGATVDELLYFYPRLVKPYDPSVIVTRVGPNDLYRGFTPEEAWMMAWRLYEFLRADFPEARIVIFCCFEHPSAKGAKAEKYIAFDAHQKEYAEATENVDFVNISDFFYEDPAFVGSYEGFRDIFREDGLHLRPEIYRQFADYFVKTMEKLGI